MNEIPPSPEDPGEPQQITPEQEEMLRQMEEEMRRVRVQDVVTQSAVSILNMAARRISKEDERDLEQARIGIDAVRALVDLLESDPQREVRNALSQIQIMYTQAAGGDAAEGAADAGAEQPPPAAEGGGPEPAGGPPPSKLWTPGS